MSRISQPPLKGQTFSRLTTTGNWKMEQAYGQNTTCWEVFCSCKPAVTFYRPRTNLLHSRVKSCGCLVTEFGHRHKGAPLNYLGEHVGARNITYAAIRSRALLKKLPFTLTSEYVTIHSQLNCFYCDCPPSNRLKRGNHDYSYNGFDQIDPGAGYTPENVVTSCWNCNRAKGSLSQPQFFALLQKILDTQQLKSD